MGPSGALPRPALDPWLQPGTRGHSRLGVVARPPSYGIALLPLCRPALPHGRRDRPWVIILWEAEGNNGCVSVPVLPGEGCCRQVSSLTLRTGSGLVSVQPREGDAQRHLAQSSHSPWFCPPALSSHHRFVVPGAFAILFPSPVWFGIKSFFTLPRCANSGAPAAFQCLIPPPWGTACMLGGTWYYTVTPISYLPPNPFPWTHVPLFHMLLSPPPTQPRSGGTLIKASVRAALHKSHCTHAGLPCSLSLPTTRVRSKAAALVLWVPAGFGQGCCSTRY